MKRICVFCGSKPGRLPGYVESADALGAELARTGVGLIYGGGSTGMMGRIADSVIAHGGEAIGIIPRSLLRIEVVHRSLSELKVVETMHERKALMAELADAFIALPGGLGTLEELLEMLTWAKLKFHNKPCAVLNACGYYDALGATIDQAIAEGFAKPADRKLMIVDDDPARLLRRIAESVAQKQRA
ncbi:MAG: TIGR00730 family Rossman fold protein [bacterium]